MHKMTLEERVTALEQRTANEIRMSQYRLNQVEERLAAMEQRIAALEDAYNRCADLYHSHDEYASVDHVERSESDFSHQLYRIKEDISNLEYRCDGIERTAERAQDTAEDARRLAVRDW